MHFLCTSHFRIIFKVLLHVMYNFVLNVFNVFVHNIYVGKCFCLIMTGIMRTGSTCQKLKAPVCWCDLLSKSSEN